METLDYLKAAKDSIVLHLTNFVMANNSLSDEFSLKEHISVVFKDGKVYVSNTIESLKDVDIDLYYGMQTAGFGSWYYYITNDLVNKQRGHIVYKVSQKPTSIIAVARNKNKVVSKINHCSLESSPSIYALHTDYSSIYSFIKNRPDSGAKGYYVLINERNTTHLNKGDSFSWDGYYQFF